jgi:hypothetical protein
MTVQSGFVLDAKVWPLQLLGRYARNNTSMRRCWSVTLSSNASGLRYEVA